MERSNKKSLFGWVMLAASLLGLLTAFVIFRSSRRKPTETGSNQITPESYKEEIPFDAKQFYAMVDEVLGSTSDDTTKRIITAQAMHETGNFTSPVFLENNNAFGMRQAEKRDSTAIAEARGYAVYENVDDSIRDLELWFQYHQLPVMFATPGAYSAKIRELGYYEAPYADYTSALKAHLKKLETLL